MTLNFRLFLLAALACVLVATCAHAQAGTATVTWSLPVQNTDGTAIAAGTLASTTVSWGSCGATAGTFGVEASRATVAVPATTYTVQALTAGTYCFRALASTTGGISSEWSLVASKVVPAPTPPTPKPPVLTTISTVAYELQLNGGGERLGRNVGTVPLGIECGTAHALSAGTFYEVPSSAAMLWQRPKGPIVARCSYGG